MGRERDRDYSTLYRVAIVVVVVVGFKDPSLLPPVHAFLGRLCQIMFRTPAAYGRPLEVCLLTLFRDGRRQQQKTCRIPEVEPPSSRQLRRWIYQLNRPLVVRSGRSLRYMYDIYTEVYRERDISYSRRRDEHRALLYNSIVYMQYK